MAAVPEQPSPCRPRLLATCIGNSPKHRLDGRAPGHVGLFLEGASSAPSSNSTNGASVLSLDLVVIDGAKALHRAAADTFGQRALIQRCQQHKKRNVSDALPQRVRGSVLQAMNQAYAIGDAKDARKLLENLARRLEHDYPGAAASLREGLEETLTVMRLELPQNLERVLSSTNLIENLFSRVRDSARR